MSGIMAAKPQGGNDTLALVLHAFGTNPAGLSDVKALIQAAYGPKVKICAPTLSHASWLSTARATELVVRALEAFEKECDPNHESIKRIVFVGHSFGGLILRRAFLVASGSPWNFRAEPGLCHVKPRPWARKVERIVLLAAFVRGWKISKRLSWKYSFGFNLAGFVGHIVPRLTPTFFDARLGAPFTVQTRLHWLAYRRRDPAPGEESIHRPILIQLIGTRDDLVSPFDQVDISVDASGGVNEPNRDYYLIEVPQTDHNNILKLKGNADALRRADILFNALTSDRPGLADCALDPALLTDEIEPIDHDVKNTVFVIHGIRDDGFWTHRVAEHVRRAGPQQGAKYLFRGWTATYGYFAMLPFILPWVRREKVEWFMDQYVSAFSQFPESDFHYVGHSNGTYLAAKSFDDYPAFHLKNVLFAGSVVRYNFPWAELVDCERVHRVQNIVASADWVVALLPKSLEYLGFDLGGAGFDGFADAGKRTGKIDEFKYVRGGHGAGIIEDHWQQITDFIANGTAFTKGPQENLYAGSRKRWLELLAKSHLTLPLGALLALLVPIWWLFGFPLPRFDHIPDPWRVIEAMLYLLVLAFIIVRV